MSNVNAIQRGRFHLIAHIGKLLPAGKVGAGRGNKNSKAPLPFSKRTLSAYRKVTKHQAARRLGEIIREGQERGEIAGKGKKKISHDAILTLPDLGLNLSQSSRAQQLAAIPVGEIEKYRGEPNLTTAGQLGQNGGR